jgi:hypothetical protein
LKPRRAGALALAVAQRALADSGCKALDAKYLLAALYHEFWATG